MNQVKNSSGVDQIDSHKDLITDNFVCNVEPSQEKAQRVFLPLPYFNEKILFAKF